MSSSFLSSSPSVFEVTIKQVKKRDERDEDDF